MRGLEKAMEWLRPLVDAKQEAWDYCVVWKFSDDPSSGGGWRCYEDANVKEDQEHLTTLCRDAHLKHVKRTKVCKALQYFPFSIDIFPGNANLSDLLTEDNLQNHPLPIHLFTPIPTIQTPDPSTQYNFTHPSYEGSSIGLNPSNEHPSFEYSNYSNVTIQNEVSIQRPGKEPYKPKNLFAESRRNKLRDKLYTLRSLVHTTSKMDESATVRDVIEYIGELQQELKKLNEELKEIEEENAELKSSKLKALVEVNQIGERDFLIYICEKKWGGFKRSMEAIDSLGLQAVEVNVTTWDGMVLNSLKVESQKEGIQPENLRDSLILLTE
ncbi:hypothetical protein EZV62_003976 [Acer yangbiense]|uniref:BHLH domain-containing protein n=1 Tax=Acer yangbiense TaxID=1000413 RepID=A0A5C7IIS3_9ROSI|nr:hypothetical protein EZV62_003976 [Acer yangbiense]